MVTESARLDDFATGASAAPRSAELAFVAFLLLIFVGFSPFALRDAMTMPGGGDGNLSGAGDTVRQLSYAAVFAWIVFAALREQGARAFSAVSPILVGLLLWCVLSAAWSPEAGVTLRRATLASVVVASAMFSVSTIGWARSLTLWRWILAFVLVVNWLSIPFVHQAVHLANDPQPSTVGDWRGLYFHKNIAGAVSAITAILFLFSFLETRRLLDLAVFAAAIGFAIMTRSKSSLLLLPVALAAGLSYRFAWRRPLDRWIAAVFLALLFVVGASLAAVSWDAVSRALGDPAEFTGRAEIWRGEIAYIVDHPYFGSGFGTFSDTGALSPLHHYVASAWVGSISHGHNAYLQLLMTIGGIGFALAMIALILQPIYAFWREDGADVGNKSLLFALFVFIVLHNFLESDFLESDSPAWVAFLLMLAALRLSSSNSTPQEQLAVAP